MITYDVLLGNCVRRGLSYAELISLPIEPTTFIRRGNSDWFMAQNCVELSHIICNNHTVQTSSNQSLNSGNLYQESMVEDTMDYENENFEDNDDYDEDVYDEEDEYDDEILYSDSEPPISSYSADHSFRYNSPSREPVEERIFIPSAEYFKCKQKRKAAIIGVCTLGLAGLSLVGVGNTWRSNIFRGTSFMSNEGIGFVLKGLSFCFLTALIAIPYFIYSVFALIYYSIRISKLKN